VMFVEYLWTPGDHDQAEDRVHRIGQNETCNIYYCVSPGTIDQYIWKVLRDKRKIIESSVDGMIADDTKKKDFIDDVLHEMEKNDNNKT
jgi:SWI/SNF-related matrix-associated actin-dependent regulator 1 of chromatin subfamily A